MMEYMLKTATWEMQQNYETEEGARGRNKSCKRRKGSIMTEI
jgi:hypothetical protein